MPQSPQIKKIQPAIASFAPVSRQPKPAAAPAQSPTPASQPTHNASSVQSETSESDHFNRKKILFVWEAKEYETMVRPRNWYIGVFIFFFAMVAYALFDDNLLMGILFILFGMAVYLFEKKQPRAFKFQITEAGVIAHTHLYEFDSIDSFWIFYEPDGKKKLSLKSKKSYIPFIHIPIGQANPVELRKVLLDYLPEEKQEEGLLDAFERFF